jgi:PAS domain-containing protein
MLRYSLSVRLALFFSFIVLLVTTALSAVVFYQFDDKINQQISRNLSDIADHKALEINNALQFERTNLLSWRASSVMLDVVVDDLDKRIATELLNLKQSYQLQGDLYVFNAAGVLIASTQQNVLKAPLPKAWQSQKDYALVFKHEVPFVSGSIIAHVAALKPPHFDMQGYLVMTHSWVDFSRLLMPKDISFALHKAYEGSQGSAELFTATGVKTIEINDALKRPLWFFDGISYLGSISKAVAFDGFNFQIAAFMPENLAEKPLFELTQNLLLAATLVGLPILVLVNLLSRHLVTPIKKLTATIRTIEDSNDLSIQVPVSGHDEVADLGFAFNRMATRLGELFHKCSVVENELENLNQSLEHQVIERTAQLQDTLLDLRIAATAFESQEAIVITDTESVILRINKAFTESTGYTEEDAVGRKISILKSGHHDADFYREMWGSLLATGLAGRNLGPAQEW